MYFSISRIYQFRYLLCMYSPPYIQQSSRYLLSARCLSLLKVYLRSCSDYIQKIPNVRNPNSRKKYYQHNIKVILTSKFGKKWKSQKGIIWTGTMIKLHSFCFVFDSKIIKQISKILVMSQKRTQNRILTVYWQWVR